MGHGCHQLVRLALGSHFYIVPFRSICPAASIISRNGFYIWPLGHQLQGTIRQEYSLPNISKPNIWGMADICVSCHLTVHEHKKLCRQHIPVASCFFSSVGFTLPSWAIQFSWALLIWSLGMASSMSVIAQKDGWRAKKERKGGEKSFFLPCPFLCKCFSWIYVNTFFDAWL